MYKQAANLIVFLKLFLCVYALNETKFYSKNYSKQNENLQICVLNIIKTYFNQYKELTYVDINGDNQEIIKTINSISIVAVKSKTLEKISPVPNASYIIIAGNVNDFAHDFSKLSKEPFWNPYGRFLILIKCLFKQDLKSIFDILIKFHVINVVVVDEFNTNLYTYNPFENYQCGHRYDRIIDYGKCLHSSNDLYPYKVVTGLRNCNLKVHSPHWPPYSMDPAKNKHVNRPGVEEFVLQEISNLEHFTLNFSYSVDGEIFSKIQTDMSVLGPLYLLQGGDIDVVLGGMLLTQSRAKDFSYIYNHLAYFDDFRYQVKKATAVSSWKNLYLEFRLIVWIALLFSFITYYIFFIVLVRPKDIGQVCLNMLAFMFLNGRKIKGNRFTKYLFLSWVWFAYLINAYYQSSLVSLTTNPYICFQVSDEEDIAAYNIKPCVSQVIRDFLSTEDYYFENNQDKECNKLLDSIHTASRSSDKFTVTLHSIYTFNEHSFYDETGQSMTYTFNRPLSKIIYAIYLYKGFPLLQKFHIHALRLRENGMIQKYLQLLFWLNNKRYNFINKKRKPYHIVPWCILLPGYVLSFTILVLEIVNKKHTDTKKTRPVLPIVKPESVI